MSDMAEPITVEANKAHLPDLLKRLREEGRMVLIVDDGVPIAELSPFPRRRRLLAPDPRLKVVFNVEPSKLTTEEDWPECLR